MNLQHIVAKIKSFHLRGNFVELSLYCNGNKEDDFYFK